MDYKAKLRRNIRLFYFTDFLVHLYFIIPIWVAFYTRYLTFTQIALLHSIQYGLQTLLELPTGALADLMGRKKTIMLGYFLSGIGILYAAFAQNFLMFFVSFAVRGLGEAMVSGSDVALFYDTLKELKEENKYAQLVAKYGFVIRLSLMTGTLLGGYLFRISPGLPYLLLGLAQIASVGFLFFFAEPHIDTVKFTLTSYLKQTKDGFKELFKNLHNRILTLFYTLVGGITWACLIYFNQPFAKDTGFSEVEMGWLFAAGFLFSSLALIKITKLMDILARDKVYLAFPLVMIISLLPGIFATKILAVAMLFLVQLSGGARFAFLDKYTNDEFESKYRATAVSGLNMLVSIFAAVTIGISGVIQDVYDTRVIFSFLGMLSLFLVLPSALSLIRAHKKVPVIAQRTPARS